MNIVLATTNPHKLEEVRQMMSPAGVNVLGLDAINFHNDIVEDGSSMTENALIKARAVSVTTTLPVIADDSGLEVDVLGGAPGIYTARYAGPKKNSVDNMKKLLHEMIDAQNRDAQFRAVVALIINGQERTFEGVVRGEILKSMQGTDGFGYDPIFRPEAYDISFAQMTSTTKNKLSHRGLAIQRVLHFLKNKKG